METLTMSYAIITKIIDEMTDFPDELQRQVLQFVITLRQQHQPTEKDVWDVLESLIGTVDAHADWSAEHDHYLYGTPKHQGIEE
jgi:hypothetical protein